MQTSAAVISSLINPSNKHSKTTIMADENKDKPAEEQGSPEPAKSTMKAIKKDYMNATPKERLKNFTVDPVTKTLRRA